MNTAETIAAYLRAIEQRDDDALARLLHGDLEVIEHPNKVWPTGKRYDLAAVHAAAARGRALLASERFDVRAMIVDGARAAVQTVWTGTVAATGARLTAQICSIFELRDGRIWRQEQYDCFEA